MRDRPRVPSTFASNETLRAESQWISRGKNHIGRRSDEMLVDLNDQIPPDLRAGF